MTAKITLGSEAVAKLPVAAIATTYGPDTHADAIVTKILEGYAHDGGPGPGLKLTSIYVDQQHPKDMSRDLEKKHGFRIAKSIDEALTLGTDRLAVSGVLILGEHGVYPDTAIGQKQYPLRKFFDEATDTFKRVGQVVPVFNDKHLSYNWADAKHMYDTALERNGGRRLGEWANSARRTWTSVADAHHSVRAARPTIEHAAVPSGWLAKSGLYRGGHGGDDAQPELGTDAEGSAVPCDGAGQRSNRRRRVVRHSLLRRGGYDVGNATDMELSTYGPKRVAEGGLPE